MELFRNFIVEKSDFESPFELIEDVILNNNKYLVEAQISIQIENNTDLEKKAKVAMVCLNTTIIAIIFYFEFNIIIAVDARSRVWTSVLIWIIL